MRKHDKPTKLHLGLDTIRTLSADALRAPVGGNNISKQPGCNPPSEGNHCTGGHSIE